ncbi:unnamed protein product [Meganyctiphanes norvegica]|uniref:Uncharacterized protein n=1 Tax=Meganyctiphanes norvegica TaxID=48144 RepID=A0AAV2SCT9_MEGNR
MPKDFPHEGRDFLKKCLDRDPAKRWTCEQLLTHNYFKGFSFKLPDHELDEFERIRRNSSVSGSMLFPQLAASTTTSNGSLSTSSSPDIRQYQARGHRNFDHLPTI